MIQNMNKDILITSKVKKHKKNYKYLTYGCVNIFEDIKKKDFIFDHPWNNQKNYSKDSVKIEKIYSYVLRKISKILNNYHKVNKDLRYWKIYIGPWLHVFIVSYYEKNFLIEKLAKYKKTLSIPVVELNTKEQIPKSFVEFFTSHINSSSWSDYLFSYIFLNKKLNKKNFIIKKKFNSKKKKNIKYFNLYICLKKILITIFQTIFLFWIRKQPLVILETYLSLKNNMYLMFKNCSFPFIINLENKKINTDINLRKSLCEDLKEKNIFLKKLLRISLLHLPTDFLENFSFIGHNISSSNLAKKPKVIFTSNIYSTSLQSRYIAECVFNGTKLILSQHGGRYGHIKNFFYLNFEVDISDFYISWGKNKHKKIKNLGITRPYKKLQDINSSKLKNKILFIMITKSRYARGIDSELNLKKFYDYYSKVCPNFYSNLSFNLKSKLIYRSGNKNWWNEKEMLEKKCKLSSIDFNRHKTDLFSATRSSRITVCSYLSTTFLELLAANKPVILFTPFSHNTYNSETLRAFDKMGKSDIFFNNEIKAANFINKNWESIDKWWCNKKVQESRKFFLNNFSKLNPNIIDDIQILINKCISK
jgi:putative transferase (TIGR04331 family)